jgi:SAM-dependent methyltransferase
MHQTRRYTAGMPVTAPSRRRRTRGQRASAGWRSAANSDKHELYELAVQDPEAERDLIDQVWSEQRGRRCHHIREDFCGSAAVCLEWVKGRKGHTAVGVDIDDAVLAWARARAARQLTPSQARRLRLVSGDVRTVATEPVDSVLAMNFSYFLFKTRRALLEYFRAVRGALVDDGLFLLDAYGGSDAFRELEEERDMDGFTYVWDQHSYDPITADVTNYIHFRFPDGSEMRRAFCYHWRLWTLPEIQELLLEAGFQDAVVYWEGTDEKTHEGNGEFHATRRGEADFGWIAYIVGLK